MTSEVEIVSVTRIASSPYKHGYYVRYRAVYQYCETFDAALRIKRQAELYVRFLDQTNGPDVTNSEERNTDVRSFLAFTATR